MASQRTKDAVLGKPGDVDPVDLDALTNPPDNPAEGQELAEVEGVLVPGANAVVDSMIQQLAIWAEQDAEGSDDALQEIVAGAWQAETTDELLTGSGAIHARDILDTPLYVLRMTVVPSDIEDGEGCPFYAVFHGTRAPRRGTGENGPQPVVVTCGGWRVVAEAGNMRKRKAFPQMLMIVNARRLRGPGRCH